MIETATNTTRPKAHWPDRAALVITGVLAVAIWGCQGKEQPSEKTAVSLTARAQEFRSLLDQEDFEAARAMMAPDPRRWWGEREGDGRAWRIDSRGPWADWDEHFRSRNEVIGWSESERSATLRVRETNDYFRLLERGWVTTAITYYFDEAGRIEGLLIAGVGDRPPGRTDEFIAWAKAHDADELDYLMPGGEIDPTGDRPQRFRRLLETWRRETGLEPIE